MTIARTWPLLGLAWIALFGPRLASAGEPEALTIVAHADVDETGMVGLHAALRSPSGERIRFWVADPYHGGDSVVFRLTRDDGASFVPWAPAAPRTSVAGPMGSVQSVVETREWGGSRRTRLFLREARPEDPRSWVPDRLPPGRYTVRCIYVHPCDAVPVMDDAGVPHWTPSPGLFAGTLRANPATIVIPALPAIVVEADLPAAPHQERWPLTVTIRNRGTSSAPLPTAAVVVADGAPDGAVSAKVPLAERMRSGPSAGDELPPGGSATFAIELGDLLFDTHRHKLRQGTLGDLVGPALVRLEVQLPEAGTPPATAASPGVWRLVSPPPRDGGTGR